MPAPAGRRCPATGPAPRVSPAPDAPRTTRERRRVQVVRSWAWWCAAWRSWRSGTTGRPQHLVFVAGLRYYMQTYLQGARPARASQRGSPRGCRFGTAVNRRGQRLAVPSPWRHRERRGSVKPRVARWGQIATTVSSGDGGGNFPPPLASERLRKFWGTVRQNPRSHGGASVASPVTAGSGRETPGRTVGEIFAHRHRQARSQRGRRISDPVHRPPRPKAQVARFRKIAATVPYASAEATAGGTVPSNRRNQARPTRG